MAPSTIKSEILTHELTTLEERQLALGLQPVALAYPQQVGHHSVLALILT
jgi:hypothetical protein